MQPAIIIICCMSRVMIICEFCIHVEEQRVKNDQLQAFNMLNIRVSGIKIQVLETTVKIIFPLPSF